MPEQRPLHPVSRSYLDVLSDDVGIMQHAKGPRPDPAHGYCTDDVARALQVDVLHQRELGWPAVSASAWRYVRFLDDALDRDTGRFRNFRRMDGSWLESVGSEDSHGRAILALGETMAAAPDEGLVEYAESVFTQALPAAHDLAAMRAQSSVLLGCDAAIRSKPTESTARTYRLIASRLRSRFDAVSASDWPWPESRVTYENAMPVRALVAAGRYFDSRSTIDVGLATLDWLIAAQTSPAGHLSPIGNTWWTRDAEIPRFDQQPIEATALLLAAESAHELRNDERYRNAVEMAYAWFLGGNDLGVSVALPDQGACFDGLTPRGVNVNQGAESTLMWLIALEHVRAFREGRSRGRAPIEALPVGAAS
jgi:hypothetical protein